MGRSKNRDSAAATHAPAPTDRRGTSAGRSRISAGLLLFRRAKDEIEVLIAHPGGPFFRNKDDGFWTIPKGEAGEGEDLLTRAKIEFEEEVGFAPPEAKLLPLGWVKQKGGKIVQAWAFEGDLAPDFELRCNTFEIEWPPHSGKTQSFPEVDRAEFFSIAKARMKMKAAQVPFLDRLLEQLS